VARVGHPDAVAALELDGAAQRTLYGPVRWRFQGTNDEGLSLVFDVYKAEDDWRVHRTYG